MSRQILPWPPVRRACEASDAGAYSVVVTNEAGSVESDVAVLAVHHTLATRVVGSGTIQVSLQRDSYTPGTTVTITAVPQEATTGGSRND